MLKTRLLAAASLLAATHAPSDAGGSQGVTDETAPQAPSVQAQFAAMIREEVDGHLAPVVQLAEARLDQGLKLGCNAFGNAMQGFAARLANIIPPEFLQEGLDAYAAEKAAAAEAQAAVNERHPEDGSIHPADLAARDAREAASSAVDPTKIPAEPVPLEELESTLDNSAGQAGTQEGASEQGSGLS